jgi:hypothetical protein
MPIDTQVAVDWALTQTYTMDGDIYPLTKDDVPMLTTKVREYFNTNKISYITFSYDDLKPFLN